MRRWLKRIGIVVLALALALGGLALWKRDEVARLMAVNSLFAPDRMVANFSAMDALFLTLPIDAGGGAPLPDGPAATMPPDYATWAEARGLTGIVVLHDGAVVFEDYRQGTARNDLRISWSMAKSALSLVLGTLNADGTIPDLDAPVTRHAPELRGSAYDGASIRDVLRMASGVAFDEDYLDFWSDINRMGRVLALGGSMDGFAAGQSTRRGAPGADWHYVSIDTHVLGMVIRGATGRTIPDLIAERLLRPIGIERAPFYLADGHGVAFVLGGLNMTTRDYARLGQLVAQDGQWEGRSVVPADWIEASTQASAPPGVPDGGGYGYQWWIPPDPQSEVYARGIYGQYIWIDRARDVVIAVNAADPDFEAPATLATNIAQFRAIADSISQD